MTLIEVAGDQDFGNESPGDRTDESVHQLQLLPLDDNSWRLCDGAVAAHDPDSVVAYVERCEEGLAIVWLVGPHTPRWLGTLDDVLAEAVNRLAGPISAGPRRPTPIPHRAPW